VRTQAFGRTWVTYPSAVSSDRSSSGACPQAPLIPSRLIARFTALFALGLTRRALRPSERALPHQHAAPPVLGKD
jgi:hypothetical protein